MNGCSAADHRLPANVKTRILQLRQHSLTKLLSLRLGTEEFRLSKHDKLPCIGVRPIVWAAELRILMSAEYHVLCPTRKAVTLAL